MNSRERNMRGGEEISRLRRLQLQVAEKMRREYRRNGQVSRGNTVWVTLFGYLLDEVREREASLDKKYQSAWHDSEEYLSQLDIFIQELKKFSASEDACDEETKRRKEDIQKDIEGLQQKIDERSELLGQMSGNLQGLQKTREELLKIRKTPEFAILANWVRTTCDKCLEIEKEISETKVRIGQKNEDVLEYLGYGHNIFSKVNIEDLKKLPPFTTDEEPSTSFNMSFH